MSTQPGNPAPVDGGFVVPAQRGGAFLAVVVALVAIAVAVGAWFAFAGGSPAHVRTSHARPAPGSVPPTRATDLPRIRALREQPPATAPQPAQSLPPTTTVAQLQPDPEAAQSFPEPSNAPRHAVAVTPDTAAADAGVAPGAPSDAEIRRELAQMRQIEASQQAAVRTPGAIDPSSGALTPPPGIPGPVAALIAGGNAIADFPYRWGGGHLSFIDNAYDCSGSVSYALAAAGLLSTPLVAAQLMSWGAPGPGRWITVYASAVHVFMYVAGVRFDTSFRSGPYGSRWQSSVRNMNGFTMRHWPGL